MIDGLPLSFFLPLAVHAVAGLVTGITGLVTFRVPKRRGRHDRWGTRYLWAYTIVFLTATILSGERWETDASLFLLAVIGYGFALGGYGARRFREVPRIRHALGKQWIVVHLVGMIGSYVVLWTAFYVDNAHLIPGLKELPPLTFWVLPTAIALPFLVLSLARFAPKPGPAHATRSRIERRPMMARIGGMERPSTLLARLAFFLSRCSYGRVIAPARVYALDSGLLLAVGLMEGVQEGAKQTNAPIKQLARLLVAWRIGCPWCLDFDTRTSEKLGVTDEQLRALPGYEHSSVFSREECVVLCYADAMTRTPVHVPDAVFQALKAIYTDRQILEVTAAIAWENFHARVNHALDLQAEGVASQVCLLPMPEETTGDTSHRIPAREVES